VPDFPGVTKRLNWSFADFSTFTGSDIERLKQTVTVRDEIRETIKKWVAEATQLFPQ